MESSLMRSPPTFTRPQPFQSESPPMVVNRSPAHRMVSSRRKKNGRKSLSLHRDVDIKIGKTALIWMSYLRGLCLDNYPSVCKVQIQSSGLRTSPTSTLL
ncbi:unnamed protein product [Larinioides sclopetarius]|uniref:Uncharacterized protein n=1 Tax=Larinioides sclopetarius TaxID=280406 RepID=A0AAV1ZJ74_9ARAC